MEQAPDLEHRLSELQGQIDRLSLSLHLWQETQEQDASQRTQDPFRQLQEQAASLTEVCIATANMAQTGFDRSEARLAALEAAFHRRITELSHEVSAALSAPRIDDGRQAWALARSAPQAWPLEGVVRLHNQLRESDGTVAPPLEPTTPTNGNSKPISVPRPLATGLSERVDSLERALTDGKAEILEVTERTERAGRTWRAAVIILLIGLGVAGVIVARVQRQAGVAAARLAEVERQARDAKEAANQQLVATREDAARQVAQARDSALKAQTISDVLAAPDLVRYNLTGADGTGRFSAQALWSRSRGFVFSGSRLPPPPPDATYQVWLMTTAEPISAGMFVPDSSGRVTLAVDNLARVDRPIVGITVTLEPRGGREVPTGQTILARPVPAPVPAPSPVPTPTN